MNFYPLRVRLQTEGKSLCMEVREAKELTKWQQAAVHRFNLNNFSMRKN